MLRSLHPFRGKGKPRTQEPSSQFPLAAPGIPSCATRRTLASGRRSRICARVTFSTGRCPVRLLTPCHPRVLARRERCVCPKLPHVFRRHRLRDAAIGTCFYHWRLGFNQSRLHHTYRTCGASPYIPSGLTAFPTCCFPLRLSASGRLGVLKGHLLSTLPSSEWNHHGRRSGAPSVQ